MDASGGGIDYKDIRKIPIKELKYLYRAAIVYLESKRLDQVYDINLGYAGEQSKIDARIEKIEQLSFKMPKMDREGLLAIKKKLELSGVIKKQD